MCERLGIADELIGTNDEFRQAFIIRKGRLRPLPEGFSLMAPSRIWPLVTTPTLSWFAKARMGCELLIPARKDSEDESLWTADGSPKVEAVSAAFGDQVTSEDRDHAWAAINS